MNTDQILAKLYQNPGELEKMAQERKAVQNALETLYKVANEASLDLSGMSPDEQVQLYNYLVTELQAQEQGGQAGIPGEVPGQVPAANPVMAPQAGTQPTQSSVPAVQPAEAAPQMTEEFQQKLAENMYFSELFGKNAARHYWTEVQSLQKLAEEEAEEKSKEAPKVEGSPTFEAMAKERAMKMREEHGKEAAFEMALQKRAEELLASGKV